MKQSHKDKIRNIRQSAQLNLVDLQTISSMVDADIQKIEERIEVYDTKDELTYNQQDKYDELQDKLDELSELKDNIDDMITALEDVVSASDFIEFS